MRRLLLTLILLTVPALAHAQSTVTPNQNLRWDQSVANAADLALMTWDKLVDGVVPAGQAAVLPSACVLNTAGTLATCTSPLPSMTPGAHAITVRVTRTDGTSVLTATSLPLNVVMYMLAAPANLQAVP
jgi:hypothetical protein